jgi:hypothetical protein
MAHLDDNTRTGLHALGLGLLLIGVPVLIVQVVDMAQTAVVTTDAHVLQVFRNGFLLPADGPQLTVTSTTRMERIGLAALAGLSGGTFLGLLCLPLRRSVSPWAVGRWSAFLLFLLFTWSALVWPTRSATLSASSVMVTERPALFGDLALPWSTTEPIALLPAHSWDLQDVDGRTGLFLEQNGVRIEVGRTSAENARSTAALEHVQRHHP